MTRARHWLLLLPLFLGGCGMLAGRPHPVSHHVLAVPPAAAQPGTPVATTLLVRDTEAAGMLQGPPLLYSRAPGTLSAYQYARWAEPPAARFNLLLRQRLETAGLYQAVAEMGAGVRGDQQLNTRLLEFHHDAAQSPGQARVALEADLVDRRDGRLLARQRFQARAPAPSHDAAGAAAALGVASGRVMDEVVDWLGRVRGAR